MDQLIRKEDLLGVLYIIDSSGSLNFRKRLQKLVCLSIYDKQVDYPFSFEFTRYHYGPYSFELKNLMDKLITSGLVNEKMNGFTYTYSLTDKGRSLLSEISEANLKNKITVLLKKYGAQSVSEITQEAKAFYGW